LIHLNQEIQLLTGLLEILIKDWFVAKHERQKTPRKYNWSGWC